MLQRYKVSFSHLLASVNRIVGRRKLVSVVAIVAFVGASSASSRWSTTMHDFEDVGLGGIVVSGVVSVLGYLLWKMIAVCAVVAIVKAANFASVAAGRTSGSLRRFARVVLADLSSGLRALPYMLLTVFLVLVFMAILSVSIPATSIGVFGLLVIFCINLSLCIPAFWARARFGSAHIFVTIADVRSWGATYFSDELFSVNREFVLKLVAMQIAALATFVAISGILAYLEIPRAIMWSVPVLLLVGTTNLYSYVGRALLVDELGERVTNLGAAATANSGS